MLYWLIRLKKRFLFNFAYFIPQVNKTNHVSPTEYRTMIKNKQNKCEIFLYLTYFITSVNKVAQKC